VEKWTLLEVFWTDAFCNSDGVNSVEFVASYKPCKRRTVGYYLGERFQTIIIAETRDDGANTEEIDCERINGIPRAMIEKIVPLSHPPARRKR